MKRFEPCTKKRKSKKIGRQKRRGGARLEVMNLVASDVESVHWGAEEVLRMLKTMKNGPGFQIETISMPGLETG